MFICFRRLCAASFLCSESLFLARAMSPSLSHRLAMNHREILKNTFPSSSDSDEEVSLTAACGSRADCSYMSHGPGPKEFFSTNTRHDALVLQDIVYPGPRLTGACSPYALRDRGELSRICSVSPDADLTFVLLAFPVAKGKYFNCSRLKKLLRIR